MKSLLLAALISISFNASAVDSRETMCNLYADVGRSTAVSRDSGTDMNASIRSAAKVVNTVMASESEKMQDFWHLAFAKEVRQVYSMDDRTPGQIREMSYQACMQYN